MRWTKIKNIILLLLVVVNLFLLALVGVRAWRTALNDHQAQERMLRVLENNGITFEPQVLPSSMPLTPQRLTPEPLNEAQAAALVGELTEVETLGTRTIYRGSLGTLAVSSAGEAILDYLPDAPVTEEQIWTALADLGLSIRETARFSDPEGLIVEACPLWEGIPLPGEAVRLICQKEVPVTLSFRLLTGAAEALPAAGEPITAATALLRLLDALNQQGYVCSRISDLYPGYLLSGTGSLTLEPTWFVEIDTAPGRLAIHAYTGAVSVD